MQNHTVCLCRDLYKYDHVRHHYPALNWFPFELLVQHRSLCAMHNLFEFQRMQYPPIVLGQKHSYGTRSSALFVQPVRCHLSFVQRFISFQDRTMVEQSS